MGLRSERARHSGVPARVLAVAAAVVTVAATAVASTPVASAARESFTISGAVGGLYPGLTTLLRVQVTNREQFAIVVTSVVTTVEDAAPACPATYLSVAPFAGTVRVAVGASAPVELTVTLRRAAPRGCEGATFPLLYHGDARRA